MGDSREHVTAGEFERGIKLVTDTLALGLGGVQTRLANIENTQLDYAREMGEIKSSVPAAAAEAARAAVDAHISAKRKTWTLAGLGSGTLLATVIEAIRALRS